MHWHFHYGEMYLYIVGRLIDIKYSYQLVYMYPVLAGIEYITYSLFNSLLPRKILSILLTDLESL